MEIVAFTGQHGVEVVGHEDVEQHVDGQHDERAGYGQPRPVPQGGGLDPKFRVDLQQKSFVHAQGESAGCDQGQQPVNDVRRRVSGGHLDVVEQVEERDGHGAENARHLTDIFGVSS